MRKTLTITLEEIPDELWDAIWHFAAITSTKQFGFKIEPTDFIKVDCEKAATSKQAYGFISDVISNAITLHLMNELNQKRQNEQIVDGNH